jgi:homoserine kinase
LSTNTRVEAFAPATVANLGVGFDILGVAVAGVGDFVTAERTNQPGAQIVDISGDGGKLPREASRNVATIAANAMLEGIRADFGVLLHLKKGLPLASGLGSSSASSVAAVVAVNGLLDQPLRTEELLPYALEGEAAVSGYHADNVAPCLWGGITLVTGITADQIFSLPVPDNLWLALVTPDIEVQTALARSVLPQMIAFKTMVSQTSGVAALVNAIYRNDLQRMAQAMETDQVIEPARSHLIPHIEAARSQAKQAGALAVVISGAGPTLCAVCDRSSSAEKVAETIRAIYTENGIESIARVERVIERGAYVVSAG